MEFSYLRLAQSSRLGDSSHRFMIHDVDAIEQQIFATPWVPRKGPVRKFATS